MARRRYLGLALAASLALPPGIAAAAPADCLTLRDNAQVAACANQYGSGTAAVRARAAPESRPATGRPAKLVAGDEPIALPVVRKAPTAPAYVEEPSPQVAVDRSALTNTVVAGVAGASLLVLLGFVLWRVGSTLRRACRWCGSKIARSAHTCPRCFRAV